MVPSGKKSAQRSDEPIMATAGKYTACGGSDVIWDCFSLSDIGMECTLC